MTSVTTCESLLADLKAFKEQHGEEYGLRSLGIFGSFARGEATDDSDVDIVFETATPNLFRTARMKQELEALLARDIDVVRLREDMNPSLRKRIVEEAHYV